MGDVILILGRPVSRVTDIDAYPLFPATSPALTLIVFGPSMDSGTSGNVKFPLLSIEVVILLIVAHVIAFASVIVPVTVTAV